MDGEKVKSYNKISLSNTLNDVLVERRLSSYELKIMNKKSLLGYVIKFLPMHDRLRHEMVHVKLEINFLNRKIQLLEEQLSFYKKCYIPRVKNKNVRVDSNDKNRE